PARERSHCGLHHASGARSRRASCAFALVVGSVGTNHCRPQSVARVPSSANSVGGKRARFFCSIRCRRQLACDRRRAYRSRPLSGQGIIWAIDDAASAMELLTRMEWRDLAQDMRARTLREVEAYLFERSRVYLSEQRFKNDAYWSAVSRS